MLCYYSLRENEDKGKYAVGFLTRNVIHFTLNPHRELYVIEKS